MSASKIKSSNSHKSSWKATGNHYLYCQSEVSQAPEIHKIFTGEKIEGKELCQISYNSGDELSDGT